VSDGGGVQLLQLSAKAQSVRAFRPEQRKSLMGGETGRGKSYALSCGNVEI